MRGPRPRPRVSESLRQRERALMAVESSRERLLVLRIARGGLGDAGIAGNVQLRKLPGARLASCWLARIVHSSILRPQRGDFCDMASLS